MSFSRTKYDTCNQKTHDTRSKRVGMYNLNTPVISNNCYQDNPEIRLQHSGVSMNGNTPMRFNAGPIDIDSDLKNLNNNLSRCGSEKVNYNKHKLTHFKDCTLLTDQSRLTNPACNLRGTGIDRFDPICFDPQADLFFPGEISTPTRTVFKDNHRAMMPNPKMNTALPKETFTSCTKTSSVCVNPVDGRRNNNEKFPVWAGENKKVLF
jgi:hypothetical protein